MTFRQGKSQQLVLIETANFALTNATQMWIGAIRPAIYKTVIIQALQVSVGTTGTTYGLVMDGTNNDAATFEAIPTIPAGASTTSANNNKTHTYVFGDLQSFIGESTKNILLGSDDYTAAARPFITAQFPNSWAVYDPVSLLSSSLYVQKTWGSFFCPAFYSNVASGTLTGSIRVFGILER